MFGGAAKRHFENYGGGRGVYYTQLTLLHSWIYRVLSCRPNRDDGEPPKKRPRERPRRKSGQLASDEAPSALPDEAPAEAQLVPASATKRDARSAVQRRRSIAVTSPAPSKQTDAEALAQEQQESQARPLRSTPH